MQATEQIEIPFRTATATLIRAMESFSASEPKAVLIIHTDESGAVVVTANVGKCLALGMIETVKHMILIGEV